MTDKVLKINDDIRHPDALLFEASNLNGGKSVGVHVILGERRFDVVLVDGVPAFRETPEVKG